MNDNNDFQYFNKNDLEYNNIDTIQQRKNNLPWYYKTSTVILAFFFTSILSACLLLLARSKYIKGVNDKPYLTAVKIALVVGLILTVFFVLNNLFNISFLI